MRDRNIAWWMIAAGAFVVLVAARPLTGQQPQSQDVMSALLVEVRGLRAAMERMASAGPRVQLAMGQLQLQEQRVTTMLRRLDTIRDQKTNAERESTDVRSRVEQLEEAADRAEDPKARKQAALEVLELKRMVERNATDLQRFATEEAELSNAIAAEQSRWADINRRLEELERSLSQ
jgi:chromosome segregation ATPase